MRSSTLGALGVRFDGEVGVDLAVVNERLKGLASAQSADVEAHLRNDGVEILRGVGRLDGPDRVVADADRRLETHLQADAILVATGAHPRQLETARPDGERILSWTQLYDLDELPEHLIVVGSGVTGAEFAGAYQALVRTSRWSRRATGCFQARTPTPPPSSSDVFERSRNDGALAVEGCACRAATAPTSTVELQRRRARLPERTC